MNVKTFLLSYLNKDSYVPVQASYLANLFGLEGNQRLEFYELIDSMLKDEMIRMSKKGKIKINRSYKKKEKKKEKEQENLPKSKKKKEEKVENKKKNQENKKKVEKKISNKSDKQEAKDQNLGKVQTNRKGFAFIIPEEEDAQDIYVSGTNLNGALNGDRVAYQIIRPGDKENELNPEGKIVQILERNPYPLIGKFIKRGGEYFVIPDDPNNYVDILIPEAGTMSAEENDKVIVEIVTYEAGDPYPLGHVQEIIGKAGDAGVDITSIALAHELPYQFSPETEEEAKDIPDKILAADRIGRRDLRKLFTVTIDGADAKDFDDAISVEKRGKFYNLYVHIADVSHYVKEGSAIDKDAYERGNSVYLLDRVIPMLPFELSNGICSLNPGEDRLAMTTQIALNDKGDIVDTQFYSSMIRSDHRLVYEDVSDYMEKGKKFSDDESLYHHLDLMKKVYLMLDSRRDKRGALDFDFPETKIILDENGHAVDVKEEERRIANRVIEEFMILNNVVIGNHFYRKKLPFIYRIHQEPDSESIDQLNQVLAAFHYPQLAPNPRPEEMEEILDMAKGKKEETAIAMAVLQSLQRAVYSPRPEIHFGLAEGHYSHFTAPIRRYSDLIAHRLVKDFLAGKPRKEDGLYDSLMEKCIHISETEERAEDAEHDVIDMKSAEYMHQFLGEEFDGIVSSLTNFGVFVRLDNSIEGLAHFRDMHDDYYTYDKEHFVVKGENSHRQIHYGDRVRVLVAGASAENREIDFHLIWDEDQKKDKAKDKASDKKNQPPTKPRRSRKKQEVRHRPERIETGYTGRRGRRPKSRAYRKGGPRLRKSRGRKSRRLNRRKHR